MQKLHLSIMFIIIDKNGFMFIIIGIIISAINSFDCRKGKKKGLQDRSLIALNRVIK